MSGLYKVKATRHLQPGQFYGQVIKKHQCAGVVLSELRHTIGRRLPEHSHQQAYFCFLLNGDYAEYQGGRTFKYKPLGLMFHPPGLSHRDEIGVRGGHFLSVELDTNWIERLAEYSKVPDAVTNLEGSDLSALVMRLYREFREPDNISPLAIEGAVMTMLADLARGRIKNERRVPEWLVRAVGLLHDEFRQNFTITRVADEIGVHPFHLSRVFKQFHNVTIGEYVNKLRVEFACRELCDAESDLASIALAAGFADQSHFTRVFRRMTGTTPGKYRSLVLHKE
jgi:AraC family transcriptional regulator